MRSETTVRAAGLLQLWEQAEGLPPVQRALCLAAATGADPDALRTQPYGRTTSQVLAFREQLLGPALAATATCPSCGAAVEFTVEASVLRGAPSGSTAGSIASAEESVQSVQWRAPTPDDLVAVMGDSSPGRALRRRCLAPASKSTDVEALPAAVLEEVEQAMAAADPLAEVLVSLTCPECAALFEADLDLGGFVWAEIDARARRLLHEVDVLARVYGWTEAEVLRLSEHRRAAYLRIVLEGAP